MFFNSYRVKPSPKETALSKSTFSKKTGWSKFEAMVSSEQRIRLIADDIYGYSSRV